MGQNKKKKGKSGKSKSTSRRQPLPEEDSAPPPEMTIEFVKSLIAMGGVDLNRPLNSDPAEGGPPLLVAATLMNDGEICEYLILEKANPLL